MEVRNPLLRIGNFLFINFSNHFISHNDKLSTSLITLTFLLYLFLFQHWCTPPSITICFCMLHKIIEHFNKSTFFASKSLITDHNS